MNLSGWVFGFGHGCTICKPVRKLETRYGYLNIVEGMTLAKHRGHKERPLCC